MKADVTYSEDGSATVKLSADSPMEALILMRLEEDGVTQFSGGLRYGSKRQEGAATYRDGMSFSFTTRFDIKSEEDLCNKPTP